METLRSLRANQGQTLKSARNLASLKRGRADWYRIENSQGHASTVYIYDEIGYFGVTASDFVNDLKSVTSPELTVRINSPGGDVFDGITILNALRNYVGNVTTIVDGLAASAASFIAQAGATRLMSRNSEMMVHGASGLCIGNASDMRAMTDLLDRASDNIASIYAERSGVGDTAAWRAIMDAETWYSADEAVLAGLADSVDGESETTDNSWDLSIYAHARRADAPDPEILSRVVETPLAPVSAKPFNMQLFMKGIRHGA